MCGICGVVRLDGRRAPATRQDVDVMAEAIRHRGPDAAGGYEDPRGDVAFGFRRLSIVDLATGDQPMCNEDGSVWVVFNGEIYNHRALRERFEGLGHTYHTHADTEAILHAYEEYGPDCVHHLRGMFAFAVWDARRCRVVLARDRMGVKPLYYAVHDGRLLFGSEIKALFARTGLEPRLDEDALGDYLTFAVTRPPKTLFAGVKKLAAGHRLVLDLDTHGMQEDRYWQPLPDVEIEKRRLADEDYVERLEASVRESISLRMMSDVPYGAFLSGGLDSSLNVALMAELADRPVSTFSVAVEGDPQANELDLARGVAERYGTHHHELTIGEREFLDYLPRMAYQQDEPVADPVCVPLHYVSDLARASGTQVVQVGEGSDELFSGYVGYGFFVDFHRRYWRPYQYVPGPARQLVASLLAPRLSLDRADVLERAAQGGELYWGGAVAFYDRHRRQLWPGSTSRAGAVAGLYADVDAALPHAGQLDRMIGIELRQRLPELLLMRLDKITMGSSIEAREPYLDHRLVEIALAIPGDLKYRDGITKWVLKQVALRVGLDRELVYRPKQGFCGSARTMLTPRLVVRASESILESPLVRERFDAAFIRRLIAEHQNGRADHGFRIWNLWNLAEWHRQWIEAGAGTRMRTGV